MSEAAGPPIALKEVPLHERLRRYSLPDVESTLRLLVANGNLADYDDELANRVKDAIDLCIAVRELLPTLAAPVPAWIPVGERLPALSVDVLIWPKGFSRWRFGHLALDMGQAAWYCNDYRRNENEVTHWMPLPPPPAADS